MASETALDSFPRPLSSLNYVIVPALGLALVLLLGWQFVHSVNEYLDHPQHWQALRSILDYGLIAIALLGAIISAVVGRFRRV